jgi:hypothetical protein
MIGGLSKFYPEFPSQKIEKLNFPVLKEEDNSGEEFFQRVNFLLNYTKLNENEQKILDSYKIIGIKPDKGYHFINDNPKYKEAVLNGIKNGIAKVDSLSKNIGKKVNGWDLAPIKKDYFENDYNLRAGYAKKAIYVNTPREAYYPSVSVDSKGNILNGNNNYVITFSAGKTPPAKFFWSITMYDNKNQLLVANEINRYSIGDRTKGMKYNSDGSLTIYIGSKKPLSGTSNWLPAPKAEFNLMMRIYGPKDLVLNGSWSPPAVLKL